MKKNNKKLINFNKNLKYALIKIVAVITIFQTTVQLNDNNDKNNSIQNNVNNTEMLELSLINKLKSQSINYAKIDRNSFIANYNNANSLITLNNSQVLIETSYDNGYKEKKYLDLNTLSEDNLFTDNHYVLSFSSYEKANEESLNPLYYDENGEINNLGKEETIKQAFKISQEELDFVLAGPMAEGIENNYSDVSAVMRTGLNRLLSRCWVDHAINKLNLDVESNQVTIYDIFRDPYQFSVYFSINGNTPRYEKFLGVKEGEGYQGALDTLYYFINESETPEELNGLIIKHDYLEFQDNKDPIVGGYTPEQFVPNGNKHYRHVKSSDIIPIEESILSQYVSEYIDGENTLSLSK